ncbi:MAG: pitrilysin family protein [Ignavibacteriaceae bacterium]
MEILNIGYEKYKLRNGLEVILHKNDNLPLVSVNIWYKVGSANEVKGKTGLAHLFEHMMFQGSQNVPKEMHFRYIQEAGGTLNGSTTFDRTNYYEKVPSNFLELILWLESDRMGYLLPALTQEKLNNQKDVVSNERLERYDNQPYGLAWEIMITHLFQGGHPYSWPTIGFMDDIKSYLLEDVKKFFEAYYSPANASLVVAGSFEPLKTKELIEKYFGDITGPNFLSPLKNKLTGLKENIKLEKNEDVQLERLHLAWLSDHAYGKDDAALDVLSDILAGSKNSRLYKNLVFDKEIAQDVSVFQYSGKLTGSFVMIATAKPGVKSEQLKDEIFTELNNIKTNKVSGKELIKSKNGIKSNFIYSLQNIDSIADQLNSYNYFVNEPNYFSEDLKRYENTNADLISSCIEKYLDKPYVELNILPSK